MRALYEHYRLVRFCVVGVDSSRVMVPVIRNSGDSPLLTFGGQHDAIANISETLLYESAAHISMIHTPRSRLGVASTFRAASTEGIAVLAAEIV